MLGETLESSYSESFAHPLAEECSFTVDEHY